MTIRLGDSVISVMQPHGRPTRSAFYVYVPDVDAVYERAAQAGARSIQAPTDAVHGDRMATMADEFGNEWTIATSIERISSRSCSGGSASGAQVKPRQCPARPTSARLQFPRVVYRAGRDAKI